MNVCKCIFFKDNREYRLNIRLKKCNEKSLALSVPALKSLQKSPKSSCSEMLYRYVMVKRRLVRWTPSEQCTWPPSTPSPSDGGTFRRKSLNTPNDRRAEILCYKNIKIHLCILLIIVSHERLTNWQKLLRRRKTTRLSRSFI